MKRNLTIKGKNEMKTAKNQVSQREAQGSSVPENAMIDENRFQQLRDLAREMATKSPRAELELIYALS
jgi:hypothetical protein